ncbi:chitinase [Amycolatopsis sp.]|uniref:chitinase n=1 Tax=Amycolatopsis sp. TaxID=37632 RepID=UPI002E02D5CF|nr:chitinase [Amycolatopsis sp.]
MTRSRRLLTLVTAAAAALATSVGLAPAASAAVDPILASPYIYQWSGNTNTSAIMSATGVKAFTLAFVLSDGGCNPKWDGTRSLTGSDATLINNIRAAGGDVIPSFGGWSGTKLGTKCTSASALAGAYQKVISQYNLKAIDLDIENTDEFENNTVQDRILGAVKIVKANNPGLRVVITIPTETTGPSATGKRLINQSKALGANVDAWSVMPFDFSNGGDMAAMTKSAVDGLKNHLKSTFGWTDDVAYRHSGLSSMNGKTDVAAETVTVANFNSIRGYAASHHLARFTFWAANRDHGNCGGSSSTCSGISQADWAFTKIVAGYTG